MSRDLRAFPDQSFREWWATREPDRKKEAK
jgi:hypothetical protein